MISTFFSKTKPINYVVLSAFLVLFFGFYRIYGPSVTTLNESYGLNILILIALLVEMLLINEIVRREKVTDFTSFAMLFFVLLLVVFPESMMDKDVVFCNFFLVLASWRMLSVKTIKNVKHKIFDASFCIGVASLFIDWALIYIVLVFLVINLYDRGNFKNWLVPIIGIFTVGILTITVLELNENMFFLENHYRFQFNFLMEDYSLFEILKSSIYTFISAAIMVLVFVRLRQKGGGKLLSLRILFFTFLLSGLVLLFSNHVLNAALLGLFPVSVFMTNYLETVKQNRYKEVALVILMFLPFFILAVQLSS